MRNVILLVDDERSFADHPQANKIEIHRTWQSAANRMRERDDDIAEIWLDFVLADDQTMQPFVDRLAHYHDDLGSQVLIRLVTSEPTFAQRMRSVLEPVFRIGSHPYEQ